MYRKMFPSLKLEHQKEVVTKAELLEEDGIWQAYMVGAKTKKAGPIWRKLSYR